VNARYGIIISELRASSNGHLTLTSTGRDQGPASACRWCQGPILPIIDFNGDGKVDGFEVCGMADSWDTNNTSCDIGPMPWGDGVVDVQDLIALAEYIGEEVNDPTLVAHWALDEAEGTVAYDSAGENDGMVVGVPMWQPDAGKVDGALEFDGTTFVAAGRVLSPSDGPFSVLAWVKGGAPGQAIISQQAGANWLLADPVGGCLMTELKYSPRMEGLLSQAVITDGDWHRVGFAWDGTNRSLYVDDVLVAEDTQVGLEDSLGGLLIGAGESMARGTFWEGLIDDVRIYNRAVQP
jgi:hypothetical protein